MRIIIEAESKEEIMKNMDNLNRIKKLFDNIELEYHYNTDNELVKLSSLAGLVSLGGDSLKDSEEYTGPGLDFRKLPLIFIAFYLVEWYNFTGRLFYYE